MSENITNEKKSRRKTLIAFIAIFIVAMFVAGYLVGGSLSSTVTTTDNNEVQEQNDTTTTPLQNITYFYNSTSLAQLYENVESSVAVITGLVAQYSFFGTQYGEVQGSGFVYEYNSDMVIITNKHVVNDATNITVTFSNGDAYPATVIGSDAYSDLAVLDVQAPSDEFKPLSIASSTTLRVGDPVVAVGSPFGLGGTMTTGIISQLGRTIQDDVAGNFPIANIIQTSAAINPGNSGGPLFNYEGDVIGITTAIIQNSNGLGFAIPSNTILREIGTLITTGSYNQHPWLGISGVDMTYSIAQVMNTDVTYGWLITSVTKGGAADNAGLQGGNRQVRTLDQQVYIGGDIIIAVNGVRIVNGDSFMSYLEEHTAPNQSITITVLRQNQRLDIPVELGTRPAAN